jgi:hypothetical protein
VHFHFPIHQCALDTGEYNWMIIYNKNSSFQLFLAPRFPYLVNRNLKEPSLQAEMAYMDKVTRFPFSAGEDILDLCIIKEESDPRLYTATNENKEFYKGAIYEVNKSVTFFANGYDTFKKK